MGRRQRFHCPRCDRGFRNEQALGCHLAWSRRLGACAPATGLTHWRPLGADGVACGFSTIWAPRGTPLLEKVTCLRCQRSRAYRRAVERVTPKKGAFIEAASHCLNHAGADELCPTCGRCGSCCPCERPAEIEKAG